MQSLKKSNRKINKVNSPSLEKKALKFILAGIACNSFIILLETGILPQLAQNKQIRIRDLRKHKNFSSIKSALITFEKCQIVLIENARIRFTDFGKAIYEYIGLITMLFDGYGDLMAKQKDILRGKINNPAKLIRGTSVSQSAVHLSKNTFDPIILKEFEALKFSGKICDLGCGYGRMLSKICEKTGNPGLGFDSEPNVVKDAKKIFEDSDIDIELGDITQLDGIWDDVLILIQCHVFHDFTPSNHCINIMNSYLNNFPNLKYFFFLDTVGPSADHTEILPGFDYVHALLGISPRTYEETLQMFDESQFKLVKEVAISGLPNTFLWLLSPKKRHI